MFNPALVPCPECGSPVEGYGSECYPDDGFTIECTNEGCSYEVKVSTTIRTNTLKQAAFEAHALISRGFERGTNGL